MNIQSLRSNYAVWLCGIIKSLGEVNVLITHDHFARFSLVFNPSRLVSKKIPLELTGSSCSESNEASECNLLEFNQSY